MIGTIDITVNAAHPNVPLAPVFSWRGSASRINVEGVPCLCGSWYVSAVSIAVATPDGKTATYPCQRSSNGIYSATIAATETPGKSANGITITATDEDGKDFVLGRGDLYILDGAAIPAPGDVSWTVRLLSSKPESPKDGDAYFDGDGTLMVYSDGSWRNTMPSATVPTKVSAFENDAGYITEKQVKLGTTPGYVANADHSVSSLSAVDSWTVPWTGVKSRPTTLAGYGITDAATKTELTSATADKLTAADVVPKGSGTETIATIAGKDIKAPAGGGGGIGYMFVLPVDAGGDSTQKLMLGNVYLYGYGHYGSGGSSPTLIPVCRTVDNVEISTLSCTPGETLVLPCAADDPRNGTAFDFPVGSCLEVSTAIAMADGTTKRVADVKVGDKVLSIDPLTGEKTVDTVTETAHGWKDRRDIWTFGDGTTVTTVGRHRFYDVDLGEFLYLEAWEPGEGARAADGCKVRLVGHERVEGRTEYATIWTENYNNYFAGGLLAGNRRSITGDGL